MPANSIGRLLSGCPVLRAALGAVRVLPPRLLSPIFFGFPPHRRRFRILELEPVGRSGGSLTRSQPLKMIPFSRLASVDSCPAAARPSHPDHAAARDRMRRPKGRPAFSAAISAELAARGHFNERPTRTARPRFHAQLGQARESKSGHFWSSDGTEPARGRPGRSIGRNLPMADKEMIAATLAAGVLAAAPRRY
jgi:hypothetical protein